MSEFKEIGLDVLEKNPDSGPVWVLNTTKGKGRGQVALIVARLQGIGTDNVIIPATRIPIDIAMVVTRRQLINDNQFRRALGGGLIKLLDPDSVKTFFDADPRARKELDRLQNVLNGTGRIEQASLASDDVEVFDDDEDDTQQVPAPLKDLVDRLVLSHKRGALTTELEEKALDKLANLDITKEHLKWVFDSLKGVSTTVRAQAKKMAKELA